MKLLPIALTADPLKLLCSWATAPRRIGAVAPSGKALADLITREISPQNAPVIELGTGTGVFARRLIERGIPQQKLALIESGSDFAQALESKFPAARVLCMDATRLRGVALFAGEKAGAVVSSLPLLLMSNANVVRVLRGVLAHLREDGALYQFTYGPRCPVPQAILERLGLTAGRIGRTLANIPPAAVYRISRLPRS